MEYPRLKVRIFRLLHFHTSQNREDELLRPYERGSYTVPCDANDKVCHRWDLGKEGTQRLQRKVDRGLRGEGNVNRTESWPAVDWGSEADTEIPLDTKVVDDNADAERWEWSCLDNVYRKHNMGVLAIE